MSLLARSLLALAAAALLHCAYAELPDPKYYHHHDRECVTRMFGKRAVAEQLTYRLPDIFINQPYKVVKIHDERRGDNIVGTVLIGEQVTVCNRRDHRTPDVNLASRNSADRFDYVEVGLGDCASPPADLVMSVIRHLKVSGYPSQENVDYQRG